MKKFVVLMAVTVSVVVVCLTALASQEGTRHITGKDIDIYFMNDKLFGHIKKHPLWAIYNCGSDIKGEIDVNGTYHGFDFLYHRGADKIITGTFGSQEISMGNISKTELGFDYQVFIGKKEHLFSIRYERLEKGHLVNSIIEGQVGDKEKIKMVVDGHLCPFATTGVIVIAAGSILLSS